MAHKDRNLLLLIDQCSKHNVLHLNTFELIHLPPNTTTYIQPLVQRICCLKCAYWKHLVHSLLRETERNVPITEIRRWNIMDAMRGIAVA
jgi:hypothetical protein